MSEEIIRSSPTFHFSSEQSGGAVDPRKGRYGDYLLSYLTQLEGEFRTLPERVNNPLAEQVVLDIINQLHQDPNQLTWDHAYNFEKALVYLVPVDRLKGKAWSIRQEYRALAGQIAFDDFLKNKPVELDKEIKDFDIARLRAECSQLQTEIHWLYTTLPVQEDQRNARMLRILNLAVALIATTLFVWLLVWWRVDDPNMKARSIVPFLVMIMGTLGAVVSVQQRLQAIPNDGNPIANVYTMLRGWFTVYMAPLIGAIAAVLLYLIFASGMMGQGALFPTMHGQHPEVAPYGDAASSQPGAGNSDSTQPNDGDRRKNGSTNESNGGADRNSGHHESLLAHCGTTFMEFIFCVAQPKTGLDLAKLLVWAFIAGFSERMVPDTLNRFAAKQKDES